MGVSVDLASQVRLRDWSFYGDPHEVFARLRREAPVLWHEEHQCWTVARYADVSHVLRDTENFTSERGIIIGDNLREDRGRAAWPPDGEPLLIVDPPRHVKLRRIVSRAFTPTTVSQLEPLIRDHVRDVLSGFDPGAVVEIVDAFAKPIPALVMIHLLGVPEEKQPEFIRWMDAMIAFVSNPDFDAEQAFQQQELMDCWMWFLQVIEERRQAPGADLISRLIVAEVDGERLTDMNLVTFCVLLLVGGLETSRNLTSGAIKALIDHPDQRARLVARPQLLETAVDEFLRYITPAVGTGRTAKCQTKIGNQAIEEGDFVVMLFQSANRDESVWERADQLDVTRPAEPMHVSFGWGPHVCLGAALARLEFKVMFEEFLPRFPHFELAGTPERVHSILMNGYGSMPVLLGG